MEIKNILKKMATTPESYNEIESCEYEEQIFEWVRNHLGQYRMEEYDNEIVIGENEQWVRTTRVYQLNKSMCLALNYDLHSENGVNVNSMKIVNLNSK